MKQVSLKALKRERDTLNALLPDYFINEGKMFYITAFGKDIETSKDIYSLERKDIYAQRSNANWSYFLTLGRPRDQRE